MELNLQVILCWVVVLHCGSAEGSILYRVQEEQPPNTLIGSLAADQGLPDSGHLYKLEVGAPYLRVDGKTGDIYTTEIPIDRETLRDCRSLAKGKPCYLEFEVSVTDLIQNQSPRLIEGRIEVQDINDNTPQFPSSVLTISVPENTIMGALFSIPLATDRDSDRNGVADYALTAGPDAATLFGLQVADDRGGKLPQLIVLGNLDRELKDSYDLTIKAVDGGNPQRYSSALLRVVVTDANDNAPKFEKSTYEAEVSENSPVGHSVLQVKANDSDMGPNGEIEYTLHQAVDPVPKLLRIDRSTGIIYVKGPLDREEISSLSFYVIARDKGPQPKSSKTFVTIEVTDQNDNAPAVEIRGIGLVTHSEGVANISEDMPVGTAVALVQVSDKDEGENAVVTCVVAGDVPFQLRPASDSTSDNKRKYFLQTTTPLDYERVRDYRVEIVAVDSGNPALSSTNSLKVQVTDVNDNSPIFSPTLFEVDFAEENQPGEKILDVIATDADSGTNAELLYNILPDSSIKGLFEIDPNTGEVRAKSSLDREHKEQYEFRVTAADKGSPVHKGTATVVIKVIDRNDNDPKFMLSGYSFSVLENMPPLSPVGMVTVLDMDKGENAHVHLSVEPDEGKFVVQNGTGTILSSISFDREKESSYNFRLKAVDGGEPPRSSYVGVTINVLDENDNDPVITKPSNSSFRRLSPLASPDSHVEVVEAEDLDNGPNAELVFSIAGGNPYQLFRISPSSGEITLAKEMTRKHGGLHRLVVRVSDKGKPARHATALVHIYVNETISNVSLVEALVGHSLYTPLDRDIAGDPDNGFAAQRSNILFGSLAGVAGVVMLILVVVFIRHRIQRETKSGYQAGKKETKDLYAPKQAPKNTKGKRGRKGKPQKSPKPLGEDEEVSLQKSLKFNLDGVNDSPRIHLPLTYSPGSPDIGRHYRSNSPLPSIQLQAQSPSASQKHQVVQDLPATNTFVGTGGDDNSTGSDQYSDYSYKTGQPKYNNKQHPHRRVTFSTTNPVQDLQDASQHSYYDSGLEESETPSSKSSSGPRIGPLTLPEDHYERTTPDGSIGETEHPENDIRSLPDVAMTGNCTTECSELGHSDACWMPGHPSPVRKTRNPPKLSTFVPYQDRGSLGRLANGNARLGGEEHRPRLPPSRSAYSSSGHDANQDCPLEEVPLSVASEFPPTSPSAHTPKREIYL
ncbi:protocadherin-1 [Maylandia zebra]|nr:PREDICTED: protocadherin-1-like [Pundamilia nyererei]XP_005948137.1 protocadherin-1 isoform X2 [Haplochromis burtoni]XP_006799552.1 protocadherin-1 [Neolamprologus brichardi]XP_024656594.1 protocadherin-1 [Maylandia zebra]XP_026038355.1 protocadherin-1-like isoform X2 [Astatotilapia calliptera]XP_039870562.1 protocadherin-1 isoform X2 [Simochromis diagramma]XP_039870563.1 protocadherin-1 isoform X2 [Simochromis diagramma]